MKKVQNAKFKVQSYGRGFTLVEMLAMIIVLSSIGGIIFGVYYASLRGSNKSNTVTVVRQNGDYALTQMSKSIITAKSFDGISTDGQNFTTNCTVTVGANTPTPTPLQYNYVRVTAFDGGQITYSCTTAEPYTIASSSGTQTQSLLDTSSVTIADDLCSFSCSQNNPTDSPAITIDFTLKQNSTSTFVENQATQQFKTTINPRNRLR